MRAGGRGIPAAAKSAPESLGGREMGVGPTCPQSSVNLVGGWVAWLVCTFRAGAVLLPSPCMVKRTMA